MSQANNDEPKNLSGLITTSDGTSTRRDFLRSASALGLSIGGIALTGCRAEPRSAPDSTQAAATPSGPPHQNADSKLDSAMNHKPVVTTAATGAPSGNAPAFQRFDPALPALEAGSTLRVHFHAREAQVRISDDTVISAWTFEGNVPGPILHCRVGDTVEFTLTNEVDIPHSMDFHAAQIDPKVAFHSVPKGESITFSYKPRFAGAFMYHCGTAPVLMHIGSGMHGAIIVSPREGLLPAKEFVIIESEYYLADDAGGARAFDYNKMLSTLPDFVVFNGRPNQYVAEPIRVKQGDRVRFWMMNAGPTHPCNFHVVGEQFDTVYLGAPPGSAIRGVQTFSVPPGGGMCFELVCDIPGEFPFVNHGFGHGQKGAIGFLVVEP